MKILYLLAFLNIFNSFNSINSMTREQRNLAAKLLNAIDNKDVNTIKDYLDKGGDVNFIVLKKGGWLKKTFSCSLLAYAIVTEAEEIAILLIERGANVNILSINSSDEMTPIYLAFVRENISEKLINLLLDKGAYIDEISVKKGLLSTKGVSIISFLRHKEISDKKKQVVIEFLQEKFRKHILEIILSNVQYLDLEDIKNLIELGMPVNLQLLEIANTFKTKPEIIEYLNKQYVIFNELEGHLPKDVAFLVTQYALETEKKEDGDKKDKGDSKSNGLDENDLLRHKNKERCVIS